MRRINLHNHSTFSDGQKAPKLILQEAVDRGLDAVAITDHFEYFTATLGFMSDLAEYFDTLEHLRAEFRDRIRFFIGLEVNFDMFDEADLPEEFLGRLDFILFERVSDFDALQRLLGLDLPVRIGLAHPNFSRFTDFRKLIDMLEKNDVFVELNTSHFVHAQPSPLLFEVQESFYALLRDRDVDISVGADVHRMHDDVDDLDRAYDFLEKLKLKNNLIRI